MKIGILKFGGIAFKDLLQFEKIAHIVKEKSLVYEKIVVVVSAMHGMTDYLINMAHQIDQTPPEREVDMLISVGERVSMSLLAIALNKLGLRAQSFTGSQSGIITDVNHFDAKIIDVRPLRILQALEKLSVVIVAGFQGVSTQKEITTLGRGGTDTSAVALAIALKATTIEFYKDVGAIYSEDPKKNKQAKPIAYLNYDEAMNIILRSKHKVIHPRALKLAKKYGLELKVVSIDHSTNQTGTVIKQVVNRLVCGGYET